MATSKTWKSRIRKACKEAGTYRPFFEHTIGTLAEIMERRDAALEQYEMTGGKPVVAHTNKAGATNLERNPTLLVAADCEKTALQYWRDLGLTPAGLKRIDDGSMKNKAAGFGELIADMLED